MIKFMEKFVKSKEEANEIESKLHDFENVYDLLEIIKTIFNDLVKKINIEFNKFG